MDIEQFYQKAAGFSPNPLQKAFWSAYFNSNGHPALLLRAGTGTGKTEATVFPAIADPSERRRIIMILPSKALIEDMAERMVDLGKRLSKEGIADLDITADMGGSCRRWQCKDGEVTARTHYRHLFADDIILTTLDKFLFRIFGYGEKIKSYIFPHRIFGSAVEKKPFVIFDEAHEYDGPAFSNFIRLLEALFINGKDLCVMSATLPPKFVDFLACVDAADGDLGRRQAEFIKSRSPHSTKKITLLNSGAPLENGSRNKKSGRLIDAIAAQVRKRYAPNLRIIARTESVRDLIALHGELKDLTPLIYHGRMTSQQRSKAVKEIISRQKKDEGFLILATSAIEAGCDLDAHFIVTELCNPDSLIQLIGRLNRKGLMPDAELVVVGNRIRPFVCILTGAQMDVYLQLLRAMNGTFAPEKLTDLLNPPEGDWMGEILFDMLWQYVYEGDLSAKPLWERGILVTRSWEPAVTLCTGIEADTLRPINPIQIGISRLAKAIATPAEALKNEKVSDYFNISDTGRWHAKVKRAYFNADRGEESHWSHYDLKKYAISCYENNLICIIQPEFRDLYFDPTLGYVKIPKIFIKGYKDGFRRHLDYHPKIKSKTGCFTIQNNYIQYSGRVWYLER